MPGSAETLDPEAIAEAAARTAEQMAQAEAQPKEIPMMSIAAVPVVQRVPLGYQTRGDPENQAVLLQIACAVGQFTFVFDPSSAKQLGVGLIEAAKQGDSPLLVAKAMPRG